MLALYCKLYLFCLIFLPIILFWLFTLAKKLGKLYKTVHGIIGICDLYAVFALAPVSEVGERESHRYFDYKLDPVLSIIISRRVWVFGRSGKTNVFAPSLGVAVVSDLHEGSFHFLLVGEVVRADYLQLPGLWPRPGRGEGAQRVAGDVDHADDISHWRWGQQLECRRGYRRRTWDG